MAVSEAKKKANVKWDSAHMGTIACRLKKEQIDSFKAYCAERGTTPNSVIKAYVLSCINSDA